MTWVCISKCLPCESRESLGCRVEYTLPCPGIGGGSKLGECNIHNCPEVGYCVVCATLIWSGGSFGLRGGWYHDLGEWWGGQWEGGLLGINVIWRTGSSIMLLILPFYHQVRYPEGYVLISLFEMCQELGIFYGSTWRTLKVPD